jgi:DNA polymerase-3 subunit alpha
VWITNERNRDAAYRVTLLARNHDGYLALCALLSRAHSENHWRGRAELKREWLSGLKGLIILSGAERGDVGLALLSGNREQALEIARGWSRDFPGAFYVEIQRVDPVKSAAFVQASIELAAAAGFRRRDAPDPVREARGPPRTTRVCTQGYVLGDSRREGFTPRNTSRHRWRWRSSSQICPLHSRTPWRSPGAAPSSSRWARAACRISHAGGDIETRANQIQPRAAGGLYRRARSATRQGRATATGSGRGEDHHQMGFAGYFLIVADFINWAKTTAFR